MLTLSLCLALAVPLVQTAPADLVLVGGKIVTVDARFGTVEALAVRGDRIAAVGRTAAIRRLIGPKTKVIELDGKLAIPGFIEGHGHFTSIGNAAQILDLTKARTWSDVVDMVAAAVKTKKPGEWILGRGWHQEKWTKRPSPSVEGFPTHASLSAVSPENPVRLTHASGHASFFNAKAMELAGITKATKDPEGGEIVRFPDGEPTGVFSENAAALVSRAQRSGTPRSPAERKQALLRSIRLADRECLSKGVTSFQDAGSSFRTIDVVEELVNRGELGVRLWMMVRESNSRLRASLANYRMIGVGNHHLTVRAIKRYIDGALGSRGAWLLEPYSDAPDSTGLNTTSVESIAETARLALANGFQLCVHAIGDRANREVLNLYEKAFESTSRTDLRWRIEHAQHLSAADIPRFGKLGVIASMQGVHCTSDAPWVIPRLGRKRAEEGAYVWQKLMKSGAVVTNGTDAPVEDVDPIPCYYASVTRRTKSGDVFFGDQAMSRMEALQSYTIRCAYAAFEEDLKGSLTPGKLADVVVLSKDILTVPDAEILDAKVLYTIVGGKVRYERPE